MNIGVTINRFFRKPKPETMRKNRETNQELYSKEIEWCKENLEEIKDNKFLMEMYLILITGNRKMSPKMVGAVQTAMNNPMYDKIKKIERMDKIKPILEKIVMVERLAEKKNDKAQTFVRSVKQYVQMNYRITKKQMEGLNKIYKRCSEDLFDKDKND